MKKLFIISVTLLMFTSLAFADVNKQLLHAFNKAFPSAQNVKWAEDAAGYLVSFTQSGIISKAAFDLQGNFVYALRYYKEDNLPASVIFSLRKKFPDKSIFGVAELSTPGNVNYHIILEDEKRRYNINVTASGRIRIESRSDK